MAETMAPAAEHPFSLAQDLLFSTIGAKITKDENRCHKVGTVQARALVDCPEYTTYANGEIESTKKVTSLKTTQTEADLTDDHDIEVANNEDNMYPVPFGKFKKRYHNGHHVTLERQSFHPKGEGFALEVTQEVLDELRALVPGLPQDQVLRVWPNWDAGEPMPLLVGDRLMVAVNDGVADTGCYRIDKGEFCRTYQMNQMDAKDDVSEAAAQEVTKGAAEAEEHEDHQDDEDDEVMEKVKKQKIALERFIDRREEPCGGEPIEAQG